MICSSQALREHCPDKDVVIQHLASTEGDELKDAFAVIKTHVHKHYNTPAKYIPNPQQ
jgi:signal-transduction protein with cAMP-binding, CBS, and nucleotidyltransferase domain